MKIVIQCAAEKRVEGCLRSPNGEPVFFVAQPDKCPGRNDLRCPDDVIDVQHGTWRDWLRSYNTTSNPDSLYRAACLYKHAVYARATNKLGCENVFILSAGWGLIRADFLTPAYDITFRHDRHRPWVTRERGRANKYEYKDFNQLAEHGIGSDEELYFFGGADYRWLFIQLTSELHAIRKVIYYHQKNQPKCKGYEFIPFMKEYKPQTNWHYACLDRFLRELTR